MSSKDTEEEETESDSENNYANLADSMIESSKKKKMKNFDFVTVDGDHIHLTEEQIKEQKRIEESLKTDLAKQEVDKEKNELVDLMGIDVVTKAGPITLKVYKEDGTDEVIANFKLIKTRMYYLRHTEEELKIDFDKPLEEQDPLDELNDVANKNRIRVDDFHDYFRSTKKFKPSVRYKDHPAGTVLNEHVIGIILFNSFQRQDFVTIEDFEDLQMK
ncbi:hypothetical protein Tco_0823769 [Tanacetum coccineum]|uniref:Uncharacterized protein n=1 Tax=Tanacetum coccineum TaxID=301880 RepID=A0ABQ5AIT1_9ASTR